jgi:hypothetical protein
MEAKRPSRAVLLVAAQGSISLDLLSEAVLAELAFGMVPTLVVVEHALPVAAMQQILQMYLVEYPLLPS